MIDTNNRERRYIQTPQGIAEIDIFTDDSVWVWMGEQDRRASKIRPHREYSFEQCEEIDGK